MRLFINSKYLWSVSIFFLAILGFVSFFSYKSVVSAQTANSQPVNKYYTSILIEEGDTLWEIAKENMTKEYDNITDYIEEVMSTNNLTDDHITAGCYLLIPYYSHAPRMV